MEGGFDGGLRPRSIYSFFWKISLRAADRDAIVELALERHAVADVDVDARRQVVRRKRRDRQANRLGRVRRDHGREPVVHVVRLGDARDLGRRNAESKGLGVVRLDRDRCGSVGQLERAGHTHTAQRVVRVEDDNSAHVRRG
ncbi:MAG: hypothetical protein [Cressdnaviricota sp.]|nr:MAG: hypothetical protein [Cressdnaviricota sp.]